VKYLRYDIVELSFFTGLSSFKSLNNKARKQQWPHYREQRAYGSPIHLYPLERLPDDIQVAWANWDSAKVEATIALENSKLEGRPLRVPPPITDEDAADALALPPRAEYFETTVRRESGAPPKIYDGKSRGLCAQARSILLNRFPSLAREFGRKNPVLAAEEPSQWQRQMAEDQFVYVPHYKIEAAAGSGSIIDSEQIINHLAFHKDWVRGSLRVGLEGLALINVIGDSMEPTLLQHDLILIDMAQRQIKDGLLYVLRIENNLIVKRLERMLDGRIKLKSDNSKYSEQTLNIGDDNLPQVLGRVIWFGREI